MIETLIVSRVLKWQDSDTSGGWSVHVHPSPVRAGCERNLAWRIILTPTS